MASLKTDGTYRAIYVVTGNYVPGRIVLEDTETQEQFVLEAKVEHDGREVWASLVCSKRENNS